MTYSELVKEAIRKAHEEAKAAAEATKNQVAQFEVGKTYYTRSICNHDCIFSVKVIKRTAKTVVVLKDGEKSGAKLGFPGMARKKQLHRGAFTPCVR